LRPLLHRLRGVTVGDGVFIGEEVYIETDFPECVEIQEGALVLLRSTIVAHCWGPGRVVIGRRAWVGPNCVIAAASGKTLVIGEGACLAAGSVVTSSVPPFTFVVESRLLPLRGSPSRRRRQATMRRSKQDSDRSNRRAVRIGSEGAAPFASRPSRVTGWV
jgi:acetyltransferase-like isoleucine patch superfamily enzyme